jgi:hypothetical protein
MYSDPEGTFSSLRTAAAPADLAAYRAMPQFSVSLGKLVVMSLCTFGLYDVYWAYKQWDAQRKREQEDISPFWRAVFAPLFGFSLFPRLQRIIVSYGVPATWSGPALATAYFLLQLMWRLPDPYWWLSLLSFVPIVVAQRSINELNQAVAPDAPRNATYSGANVVVIVIGGLFLLLALIGTFLSPEPVGQGQLPASA